MAKLVENEKCTRSSVPELVQDIHWILRITDFVSSAVLLHDMVVENQLFNLENENRW